MHRLPQVSRALAERCREGLIRRWMWLIAVAGACVAIIMLARTFRPHDPIVLQQVTVLMALTAAVCGAVSAISIGVLGQLRDDGRRLWLCVAFALYSLVAIPAATVGTLDANIASSAALVGAVRLCAHIAFIALLFAAVVAPRSRPHADGWRVLCLGLGTIAGAAGLGAAFPDASLLVTTNQLVRYGICVAWMLSGLLLILAALPRPSSSLMWIALGCTVIALAHTVRVASGGPEINLGFTFSGLLPAPDSDLRRWGGVACSM